MRGICKVCGCTDKDCSQCIEKTGEACYWVDDDHELCSACVENDLKKTDIMKEKITDLIKDQLSHTIVGDITIDYLPFISSNFDSTDNLLGYYDNKSNDDKDEHIIGVGFKKENNNVNFDEMYIVTQTRPWFEKHPKKQDLENYFYNVNDIEEFYLDGILINLQILNL